MSEDMNIEDVSQYKLGDPKTASFDFKSIALMVLKPLITKWLKKELEGPEIKDRFKLRDDQIDGIVAYLDRKVMGILKV